MWAVLAVLLPCPTLSTQNPTHTLHTNGGFTFSANRQTLLANVYGQCRHGGPPANPVSVVPPHNQTT